MTFQVTRLGLYWDTHTGESGLAFAEYSPQQFMTALTASLHQERRVCCSFPADNEEHQTRSYTFVVQTLENQQEGHDVYRVTAQQNFMTTINTALGEGTYIWETAAPPLEVGRSAVLLSAVSGA